MSDRQTYLHSAHRDAQSKYAYFLLAATVAVIGFALKETSNTAMELTQLPLAFAVFLWATSFVCGCLHLQYVGSSLFANATILQIERGEHLELRGLGPREIKAAASGVRQAFENNAKKAESYAVWQFRLLAFGSFAYICWHILEMYSRTVMVNYF